MRIDLHVVKQSEAWHLQSARGTTLAVFNNAEEALTAARERAKDAQAHGLSARIVVHHSGIAPEIHEFPQKP